MTYMYLVKGKYKVPDNDLDYIRITEELLSMFACI